MEFQIVGRNYREGANLAYKGVDRSRPQYVGDLGPTAAVNQLWDWYVNRAYDGELSEEDLGKARDLITAYRDLGTTYELIELAASASCLGKGSFVGYDVVDGPAYQSALWHGLNFWDEASAPHTILGPVMRLVQYYFQPRLNENGLFTDGETAEFLLQVMQSIDKVVPEFYESQFNEWHVVAVGVVELGGCLEPQQGHR